MKRRKEEAEEAAALAASAPARRAALTASLAAHGLQFSKREYDPCDLGNRSVVLFKDYLRQGIGDPDEVAAKVLELKWLFDKHKHSPRNDMGKQPPNCIDMHGCFEGSLPWQCCLLHQGP